MLNDIKLTHWVEGVLILFMGWCVGVVVMALVYAVRDAIYTNDTDRGE